MFYHWFHEKNLSLYCLDTVIYGYRQMIVSPSWYIKYMWIMMNENNIKTNAQHHNVLSKDNITGVTCETVNPHSSGQPDLTPVNLGFMLFIHYFVIPSVVLPMSRQILYLIGCWFLQCVLTLLVMNLSGCDPIVVVFWYKISTTVTKVTQNYAGMHISCLIRNQTIATISVFFTNCEWV